MRFNERFFNEKQKPLWDNGFFLPVDRKRKKLIFLHNQKVGLSINCEYTVLIRFPKTVKFRTFGI